MLVTVLGTVLWIAVGNAGLHIEPTLWVYLIAVPVAALLWLVTGLGRDDPPSRRD